MFYNVHNLTVYGSSSGADFAVDGQEDDRSLPVYLTFTTEDHSPLETYVTIAWIVVVLVAGVFCCITCRSMPD